METVKITIEGKEYLLVYNAQTGYYEATIQAPEQTGAHVIEVEHIDSDGVVSTSETTLIVLLKQKEEALTHEIIAYFLDSFNFEIKDVQQINIDIINRDLETNGNSIFISPRKLNIQEDDIIYLKKDDEINFIGVVKEQNDGKEVEKYTLICKDIMAMLDFESFVENQDIIRTTGIEDFLGDRIKKEFITNPDTLLNKPFLEVEVKTHTPKNISVSSLVDVRSNVYNFLTFANNAIEKYELKFDWVIEKEKIVLSISTRNEEKILIDATVSDVCNYQEVFSISAIAKAEIYIEETGEIYSRYLLSDKATTTNQNDVNRIYGKTSRKSVEKAEDAEQASIDVFKGNSYSHNITFSVYKKSKLIDVNKINLGTPIKIRTKNNVIQDTYISKIVDNDSNFITFTCGNLRINFIDKLLKERK